MKSCISFPHQIIPALSIQHTTITSLQKLFMKYTITYSIRNKCHVSHFTREYISTGDMSIYCAGIEVTRIFSYTNWPNCDSTYLRHLIMPSSSPGETVSVFATSRIQSERVTKHYVNQAVGSEVGQCPGHDIEIRARIGHTRGTKGEFAPATPQSRPCIPYCIYIYIRSRDSAARNK